MKLVKLKVPFSEKEFSLKGSSNDKSILNPIELKEYYSPHIMNLLKNIVKPNTISLDIGANIGIISLVLSFLSREGKVYSFEPASENFYYLEQNIILNEAKNIMPIKLAAYDQKKTIPISYVDFGGGWSFISNNRDKQFFTLMESYFGKEWVKQLNMNQKQLVEELIDCVTLDDWISNNHVKHLDLIKLDVEGSELKVLKGAQTCISKFKPDLIVEFNPKVYDILYEEDPKNLYSMLNNIYPTIYSIGYDDTLEEIKSFEHLQKCVKKGRRQLLDLYCTYKTKIELKDVRI